MGFTENGLFEEETYEVVTLKDLGIEKDSFLPDELVKWIKENIQNAEVRTEFAPPPKGTLGALVPRTKIVIKLPKFAWGIFQTLTVGLWMAYQVSDPLNMTVGGGFAFIDGINRVYDSFDHLQTYKGEFCVYTATMQATDFGFLYHGKKVEIPEIWDHHKAIRSTCCESDCQFHNGECNLDQNRFELIIKSLMMRDVLNGDGGKIGINI